MTCCDHVWGGWRYDGHALDRAARRIVEQYIRSCQKCSKVERERR